MQSPEIDVHSAKLSKNYATYRVNAANAVKSCTRGIDRFLKNVFHCFKCCFFVIFYLKK